MVEIIVMAFYKKVSNTHSPAIFSEDSTQRDQLIKTWYKEKESITVITKHPHYDGVYI